MTARCSTAARVLAAGLAFGTAAAAETAPAAEEPAPEAAAPEAATDPRTEAICALIAASAVTHGLPADFFARLIWKESRFDAKALSPAGAQGIAQFMPGTAKERGLADPWDPAQAIPASARFLADLRAQFGNWGLAAAAYNGGPDRVARWIAGGGRLPWETLDYVLSITHRPAEWFREPGREVEPRPLAKDRPFAEACQALPVMETRAIFAATSPWGVQVAGGRSHRAAVDAARRVSARHAAVLAGHPLEIVRSRRGIRGAPYQARIGAPSRKAAGQLCARLRRAGGLCVVLRN